MKEAIAVVGFILLGVVIFGLIMNPGDTSLLGMTTGFFTDMSAKFNAMPGLN